MKNKNTDTKQSILNEALIAKKYIFLKEKIIESYNKGCKILNTVKITVAVLFIIFTIIIVALSNIPSSNKGSWLILWIVVILLNIAIFITTDYIKQLVKTKVIPYLENDEQTDFYNESNSDESSEEN